jgi:membrane protein implicated in regulation of membrane protease activity
MAKLILFIIIIALLFFPQFFLDIFGMNFLMTIITIGLVAGAVYLIYALVEAIVLDREYKKRNDKPDNPTFDYKYEKRQQKERDQWRF